MSMQLAQLSKIATLLPTFAFSLSACGDFSEYVSSDAGQELTRFTPGVQSLPTPQASTTTVASNNVGSGSADIQGSNSSNTTADQGITSSNSSDSSDNSSTSISTDSTQTPATVTQVEVPTATERSSAPSIATTAIVWKPVSEGNGNLVILTPTSFGTPSITILDSDQKSVENGDYVGHTNGNRATYRFSRPGRRYSTPAFLRVDSKVYLVSSPGSRYN